MHSSPTRPNTVTNVFLDCGKEERARLLVNVDNQANQANAHTVCCSNHAAGVGTGESGKEIVLIMLLESAQARVGRRLF